MSEMWKMTDSSWNFTSRGNLFRGSLQTERLLVSKSDSAFCWFVRGNIPTGVFDSKVWIEIREIPFPVIGDIYEFRKFGVTDPLPLEFQGTFIPGLVTLTKPEEEVETIQTVKMFGASKVTIVPTEQRQDAREIRGLLLSATNPVEGRWFESKDPRGGIGRGTLPLDIPTDLPIPRAIFTQLTSTLTMSGV